MHGLCTLKCPASAKPFRKSSVVTVLPDPARSASNIPDRFWWKAPSSVCAPSLLNEVLTWFNATSARLSKRACSAVAGVETQAGGSHHGQGR